MCDSEVRRISLPGRGKGRRSISRKKKCQELEPNLNVLIRNSQNPIEKLPTDFFNNPRKYRKPDFEISQ